MKTAMPIRVKDLSIQRHEWEIIYGKTIHDNTVICDSLFAKEEDIKADLFHSVETNRVLYKKRAADLAIHILRAGIKVIFLDGIESENHVRKMSPPLYNKFYSPKPTTHE